MTGVSPPSAAHAGATLHVVPGTGVGADLCVYPRRFPSTRQPDGHLLPQEREHKHVNYQETWKASTREGA
jgi:hypothetical protein